MVIEKRKWKMEQKIQPQTSRNKFGIGSKGALSDAITTYNESIIKFLYRIPKTALNKIPKERICVQSPFKGLGRLFNKATTQNFCVHSPFRVPIAIGIGGCF